MTISTKLKKLLLQAQKNEITEHNVYKNLSRITKHKNNKKILEKISNDELGHYNFFKSLTKQEVHPSKFKIFYYSMIARLFGLTFGLRLMEKGEQNAQINYEEIKNVAPEMKKIMQDEKSHEDKLIGMIDSKTLQYTSSIILGLNDALVELTGALAGLTLAIQDSKLIAIAGTITGIAASLSMAGSSYLSSKEAGSKDAFKSSIYTGFAYIITVIILVLPYILLENPLISLAITLSSVILIIFLFTFYISVAKNLSFKKRFLEMAGISLSVAIINFFIGLLVKKYIGV
ncbi:MAG: VIT1/CCC1 transporter family protein [Candidatus Gracilibacteria bacterium]|jgi:VIT1/CCC1 family predicted Fe2+/Mn2+ transporter